MEEYIELLPVKVWENQSGNLVIIQDESLIELTPSMVDFLLPELAKFAKESPRIGDLSS